MNDDEKRIELLREWESFFRKALTITDDIIKINKLPKPQFYCMSIKYFSHQMIDDLSMAINNSRIAKNQRFHAEQNNRL